MNVGRSAGFTLMELMTVLAVVAVISAVAIPAYRGHVAKVRHGVLAANVQTIRLMQDERRSAFGEFVEGSWAPGGAATLTANLGWEPGAGADRVTYLVECATDGARAGECAGASGYTITATHADAPDDPLSVTFGIP